MRPFILSVLALFAAALVASSADDTKYEIKVAKFVPKGKSVKITDKASVSSSVKVSDDNGNALMDTKTQKSMLRVYVEKTIDVDEKESKRKKYTRTYEKAKDVENDESDNKPYQGRTVVFELSDGKWKLSAEGKPDLGESDLKELTDEVNKEDAKKEDALYPKKAVKVGETWKIPGKDVADFFKELNMDADSVKAEGKLTKAYTKDGKQWGTLEYAIKFKADLGEIKKADGDLTATIDEPIDGSSTAGKAAFKVTIKSKQAIEKDCKKFGIDLVVTATVGAERADVK